MRSIVCTQLGGPELLEIQTGDEPALPANQVRVAVKAAGVNFVDGLLIAGSYQIKLPPPFVPGGDIAGEVTEVGAEVSGFAPGDRVLASPGIGGFSEQLLFNPEQLTAIPDAMSDAEASVFSQSNGTAYLALVTLGKLQAGESVLVLGASGGTGLAAIHVAKALGARVIAAASSEEKLQVCREAGADETINYQSEDLKVRAKELCAGAGVDLVFDPVGGDYSEPALRACAPGGRFLIIGFAAGSIPKLPFNLLLLKRCSAIGVNWGATLDAEPDTAAGVNAALLSLYNQGLLKAPKITEYSLEQTGQAIADLQQRKLAGRAVIIMAPA